MDYSGLNVGDVVEVIDAVLGGISDCIVGMIESICTDDMLRNVRRCNSWIFTW